MTTRSRVPRCIGAVLMACVGLDLIAAERADAQDAEADPSPLEVLGTTTIKLDNAPPTGVRILVLNTGPETILSARPDEPTKVAISFSQPKCPEPAVVTTETTAVRQAEPLTVQPVPPDGVQELRAIPTGGVSELRAIKCKGLDASGSQVSIWGSAGGPVRRVTLTFGTLARVVSPPAEIPLRDNANGRKLVTVVCLPGAVPGTAGFLTRPDSVVAVGLEAASSAEIEGHDCASGTTATRVVIRPEDGAGLYSGTIDINGAKDKGEVKVELHERVGITWFWLLVATGIAVASVVAWMVRVRRPWGAVQRAIATLRVDVEAAQMAFKNECPAAHPKWTVVGPTLVGHNPAFDAAIRNVYAHVGLRERVLGAPSPRLAEAGDELKSLKDLATKYRAAAVQGAALARWLERQGLSTRPPLTRATVESILFGPTPDGEIDPITTLATAVSAAVPATRAYDDFVRRADTILAAVPTPTDLVLQKYLAVRSRLEQANLSIDAEKASVESAIDELQEAADNAAPAATPESPPALGMLKLFHFRLDSDELTILESPPPPASIPDPLGLPSDRTPSEWLEDVEHKNFLFEIVTIVIGAGISLISAWQTLYVAEYDWGTGGDYLAAFAFAVSTTSAVQVARHLTVGILDK